MSWSQRLWKSSFKELRGVFFERICEERKSLNREWKKILDAWGKNVAERGRRTRKKKKKDCFHILETELCSDSLTLTKLDSCRQCAQLGEKRWIFRGTWTVLWIVIGQHVLRECMPKYLYINIYNCCFFPPLLLSPFPTQWIKKLHIYLVWFPHSPNINLSLMLF